MYMHDSSGPLKNRDAVTVTSWRVGEQETIMMNKSVEVADLPPLKKFIRLKSWITAHYLVPTGANTCTYSNPNPNPKIAAHYLVPTGANTCTYSKVKRRHPNPCLKWCQPILICVLHPIGAG